MRKVALKPGSSKQGNAFRADSGSNCVAARTLLNNTSTAYANITLKGNKTTLIRSLHRRSLAAKGIQERTFCFRPCQCMSCCRNHRRCWRGWLQSPGSKDSAGPPGGHWRTWWQSVVAVCTPARSHPWPRHHRARREEAVNEFSSDHLGRKKEKQPETFMRLFIVLPWM